MFAPNLDFASSWPDEILMTQATGHPGEWINIMKGIIRYSLFKSISIIAGMRWNAWNYSVLKSSWISIAGDIYMCINSLAPGRFQINFRQVIFNRTFMNGGWGISYEIALRWMPLDLTDDKSTLVQVMAWCHQATSHYLNQCWPRSPTPYGVTRPQCVQNGQNYGQASIKVMAGCHQVTSQYLI